MTRRDTSPTARAAQRAHRTLLETAADVFPGSQIVCEETFHRLVAAGRRSWPHDPAERLGRLFDHVAHVINTGSPVETAMARYCWVRLEQAEAEWRSRTTAPTTKGAAA